MYEVCAVRRLCGGRFVNIAKILPPLYCTNAPPRRRRAAALLTCSYIRPSSCANFHGWLDSPGGELHNQVGSRRRKCNNNQLPVQDTAGTITPHTPSKGTWNRHIFTTLEMKACNCRSDPVLVLVYMAGGKCGVVERLSAAVAPGGEHQNMKETILW